MRKGCLPAQIWKNSNPAYFPLGNLQMIHWWARQLNNPPPGKTAPWTYIQDLSPNTLSHHQRFKAATVFLLNSLQDNPLSGVNVWDWQKTQYFKWQFCTVLFFYETLIWSRIRIWQKHQKNWMRAPTKYAGEPCTNHRLIADWLRRPRDQQYQHWKQATHNWKPNELKSPTRVRPEDLAASSD